MAPVARNVEVHKHHLRRLWSDWCDRDTRGFLSFAMGALHSQEDSQQRELLIAMLLARGLLASLLIEPQALPASSCQQILAQTSRMDPRFELQLLQTAISRNDSRQLLWVMELLSAANERALPLISRLAEHPDPRIQSKAVLVMGQSKRSPIWLADQLRNPDPRVRANAVEALWFATGESHRGPLLTALNDTHPRVVANAALGLYYLGDTAGIKALLQLAHHTDPRLRASGTWAIGETQDPRFRFLLGHLTQDSNPSVARLAAKRRKLAPEPDFLPHHDGRLLVSVNRPTALAINFSAAFASIGPLGALASRDVALFSGEHIVDWFQLRQHRDASPPVVGLLLATTLPETLDHDLTEATRVAPSLTRWSISRFREPGTSLRMVDLRSVAGDPPQLKEGRAGFDYLLPRTRNKLQPAPDLLVGLDETLDLIRQLDAERTVLVIAGDNPDGGLLLQQVAQREAAIVTKARTANARISAIALASTGQPVLDCLTHITRETGGRLSRGAALADIGPLSASVLAAARSPFELHFHLQPDLPLDAPLRLEIYTPAGAAALDLPPPPHTNPLHQT